MNSLILGFLQIEVAASLDDCEVDLMGNGFTILFTVSSLPLPHSRGRSEKRTCLHPEQVTNIIPLLTVLAKSMTETT